MKRFKIEKSCLVVMLILSVFLVLSGCSGSGGGAFGGGVWDKPLLTVLVTPATSSIPVTGTQQFTATAIYSDGASRDVTALATCVWTKSSADITFNATKGYAIGATANVVPVVITATFGGLSGSASITVTAATSMGLRVAPATASIPVTGIQQFTAIETFSDGTSFDRTTNAATTWTSSSIANATLSPNGVAGAGLATGVAARVAPVLITATFGVGGPSATANLTITAATSKGLTVTPATASIPVTGTQQFTAIETFSDGTTIDRTTNAATTWTSSSLANATLSPSGVVGAGLATGIVARVAPVIITATFGVGGPSATASLTVNAATSKGLLVTPATASIPVTGTQQYTAIEVFSDGTSIDRTTNALTTWTSSSAANATLSPSGVIGAGLATGVVARVAPVVITATYGVGGPTASANLTVNAATSKGLIVTPATVSIPVTGTQQYTALEIFSDGTTVDRTSNPLTAWTSSSVVNATLSLSGVPGAGLATGVVARVAPVVITATYGVGGPSATANLTINAATSKGLTVTPAAASVPVSGAQQFTAVELFSDGTSIDRTTNPLTVWTSSSVVNATLSPSGVVGAGLATGVVARVAPVVITATYGVAGPSASANLTVTAATSKSFKIVPATASITVSGGTQQFMALEIFSDGSTIDRTLLSTWSAVDLVGTGIATIGLNTGLASGKAIGQSSIKATYGIYVGVNAPTPAVLTVTAPNPGVAGAVDLKTLATYGLISHDAMTISAIPTTHIYGDVALTTANSLVGFGAGSAADPPTSPYVTGAISTNLRGNVAASAQAQIDLVAVYTDLSSRLANTSYVAGAKQLSGLLLTPGVYRVGAAAAADTYALDNSLGPLVLDGGGNPDAVFIFQASDITTTTGSILLKNGASPKNVFWVMTATATIGNGASSVFQGTVIAGTSITVNGANVEGRMLAGASGAGAIGGVNSVIIVPK